MENVTPSMRLKVNRDTFYLPEPSGGVYFRNNVSSFRMEGGTIVQWIEQLFPMFNGEHALGELTDGLPGPYRNRVMEIAEVLYKNGFVRDVSQDAPHQLAERVVERYASQIAFLDSVGDSGARRFQEYRSLKVLVVGSGSFLASVFVALLESGLPRFHFYVTDQGSTDRDRLETLISHARETDEEIEVEEVCADRVGERDWAELIGPYDYILSVSGMEELQALNSACRQEEKVFLSAICLEQVGIVGPFDGWDSAWRRLHESVLTQARNPLPNSSTAQALLANVVAFELLKRSTDVHEADQDNQFYLLDLDTLEGGWHSFLPHPFVMKTAKTQWVSDLEERLNQQSTRGEPGKLFRTFSRLTSKQTGIFHSWEEGDGKQLPLAQCGVQVVDPLSEGPATLLPAIICCDLQHEEARREAGLSGIEKYATKALECLSPLDGEAFVGVGTGETFTECVSRGLHMCLDHELSKRESDGISCARIEFDHIEDERCRYYLLALTTLDGAPVIGLGEEVFGFPVMWVGTKKAWYGCVGLNSTLALRNALSQALMAIQDKTGTYKKQGVQATSVVMDNELPLVLWIAACEETRENEVLQEARQMLEWNGKRLSAFELELEPVLKEELAGVFGVVLQEEGSR